MIVTLRSLQCDTPAYGARQGRSLEVALYSFAMNRRSGLYFSNSTPLALRALPLYSLTETQGERRVNSITSIAGIFNPSPCRYTPQLSPIFSCATPRKATGHGRGEGDTKDFLSLSKKVLVTLICVICSFFSTARRTNQEAPQQLSGFWVRRYGRRWGLRNSLRSDSPHPFSSVFLATSPPDKGGIGGSCLYSNPFALWALPLYSL